MISETFAISKNSSLTLDIFRIAAAADLLASSATGGASQSRLPTELKVLLYFAQFCLAFQTFKIKALFNETFAISKNSSHALDIFRIAAAAELLASSAIGGASQSRLPTELKVQSMEKSQEP